MQAPNPNPNPNPNQNPGQIAQVVTKLRQGIEDAFSTLSARTVELERDFTSLKPLIGVFFTGFASVGSFDSVLPSII